MVGSTRNSILGQQQVEQNVDLSIERWFQAVIVRDYSYIKRHLHMVKSRNSEGNTALHLAVRANDLSAVQILAPHEARCLNNDGNTALLIAASLNYADICRILIPFERSVCTADGRNTLMVAAECGSVDALRMLMGSYPVARDSSGTSELDYAVLSGSSECVKLLLNSMDYSPDDLKIAVHLARKRCSTEILNMLEHMIANSASCMGRSLSNFSSVSAKRPTSAKLISTATAVANIASSTATRNLISFANEINKMVASPQALSLHTPSNKLRQPQTLELSHLHDHDSNINRSIEQLKQDMAVATAQTNQVLQLAEYTLDRPAVDINNSIVMKSTSSKPVSSKPISSRQQRSYATKGPGSDTYLLNQSTSQTLARILSSERKSLASSYLQQKAFDGVDLNKQDMIKQEIDSLTMRRARILKSLKDAREYNKYAASSASLLGRTSVQTVESLERELSNVDGQIRALVRELDKLSLESIEDVASPIPRQPFQATAVPLLGESSVSDVQVSEMQVEPVDRSRLQEGDLLKENLDTDKPCASGRPKSARLQKNLKELHDSCASVKGTIQASDILDTIKRVTNKIHGIESSNSAAARITASVSRSQAILSQSAEMSEQMQLSKRATVVDDALDKLERNYIGVLQKSKYTHDTDGDEKILSSQYGKLSAEQEAIAKSMQGEESKRIQPFTERHIPIERRRELLYRSIKEEREHAGLVDPSKTPLMQAVLRRNIDECSNNIQDVGKTDSDKRTALMLAAENGFTAAVRLLVPHEQRRQDKYGQTALMKAAIANNPEAVLILRDYEAKMHDHIGHTALFYVLLKGNMVIAELLKETEGITLTTYVKVGGSKTELMEAAAKNDIVRVYSLLPLQGKLQDAQGKTGLMYAVEANALPCIQLLASKESGLATTTSHPESSGFTALMLAVQMDNLEATKILLPYEIHIRRLHGLNIEDYIRSDAMRQLVTRGK